MVSEKGPCLNCGGEVDDKDDTFDYGFLKGSVCSDCLCNELPKFVDLEWDDGTTATYEASKKGRR
jgi:hypothetical protein